MNCSASCRCNVVTTCWDHWVPIVIYDSGDCSWRARDGKKGKKRAAVAMARKLVRHQQVILEDTSREVFDFL